MMLLPLIIAHKNDDRHHRAAIRLSLSPSLSAPDAGSHVCVRGEPQRDLCIVCFQ